MTKKEFGELISVLMQETGRLDREVVDQAEELEGISKRIGRRAVRQCNEPLTDTQQAKMDRADEKDYTRADEIAEALGLKGIKRQSDARGYAVKLLLPSGRYNSFGGTEHGWGI